MLWKRLLFKSFGNYSRLRTLFTQEKCVFEWKKDVVKYGKLIVSTPYRVLIEPVDYNVVPNGDRADVKMFMNNEDTTKNLKEDLTPFYPDIKTKGFDNIQINTAKIISPDILKNIYLKVSLPYHFSASVQTQDSASGHIECLEGDLHLESESGKCQLEKIKSNSVSVTSQSGDIYSDSYILGDVNVQTGRKGNIFLHKLQGKKHTVKTEDGTIEVGCLYSQNSEFISESGNICLGHIHGSISVHSISGDIVIDSNSGKLHAHSVDGDIKVHVMENEDVFITSQNGNITVSLVPGWSGFFQLSARCIQMAKNSKIKETQNTNEEGKHEITGTIGQFNTKGRVQAVLNISAPCGQITLNFKQWFDLYQFQDF